MENKTNQGLRWNYSILTLIVLITFIAYFQVFRNGLLNWDDEGYITFNPLIQSFNLKAIFSQPVMGNWHPLTILIYAIEYHLFGLIPAGYHAFNLLLHLLNIILVFWVIYRLSGKATVALVATLLFGIHPMHVESVAWAAELKDLLYTCFFLGSYIFYLQYLKENQKKYYLFALVLFVCSLFSKSMAVSLPLVLLLTDYYKGRKIDKRNLYEKIPFFILAVITGVIAIIAQDADTQITEIPKRLIFASYGFMNYLFKLLIPLDLSAFYAYPSNNAVPVKYYLYLFSFVVLACCIFLSLRYTKKIIFGMGFFTLTILLFLQILPIGNAIMAERYTYIPSIGIFFLAGEGFNFLWSNFRLPALIIISVSALFLSMETFIRCEVWKDDMTLWNDVISRDNTVEEAYFLRGVAFSNKGVYDAAIADFSRAIELKPEDAVAYYNRAAAYIEQRKYAAAFEDFNKAIELKPDCVPAYINRGIFLGMEKKYDEAVNDFNRAIELKPDYAPAYYNRALCEYFNGKKEAACADLQKAAKLGDQSAAETFSKICK